MSNKVKSTQLILDSLGWFLIFLFDIVGIILLFVDPYFLQRLSS